jgi:hypothetical protein
VAFAYALPQQPTDLASCYFYHSMDLPGHGHMTGGWDLRACPAEYLGNFDFAGKRSLDVGAASGFLSFEMEKRGAEVVSYDLDAGSDWDIVPHFKLRKELPTMRDDMDARLVMLKNAYWLSHHALGSKAKVYYGDIYDLPKQLGEFDVVFYGMILTHLRDPFQALYSGARLSRDACIVTGIFSKTEKAQSTFRPNADDTSTLGVKGWWHLSIGTIRKMLGILGFEIEGIVEFSAPCIAPGFEGVRPIQAIVGRRPGRS